MVVARTAASGSPSATKHIRRAWLGVSTCGRARFREFSHPRVVTLLDLSKTQVDDGAWRTAPQQAGRKSERKLTRCVSAGREEFEGLVAARRTRGTMTDEHDAADRPALDAELISDEHRESSNRSKYKVVRAGWITCIVGLIVTLAGARQLATGGDAFSATARTIHSTGLVIMLAGFGIALLGYRLPWLVAVTRSLSSSVGRRAALTTNAANRSSGTRHLSQVTMAILLSFCGWCILSLILIWLGPSSLVGLYICLMTFFLTSATIVVIANGSPLQRSVWHWRPDSPAFRIAPIMVGIFFGLEFVRLATIRLLWPGLGFDRSATGNAVGDVGGDWSQRTCVCHIDGIHRDC